MTDIVETLIQENSELRNKIEDLEYRIIELEVAERRQRKKRRIYKKKYIRTKNKFYQRTYSDQDE